MESGFVTTTVLTLTNVSSNLQILEDCHTKMRSELLSLGLLHVVAIRICNFEITSALRGFCAIGGARLLGRLSC